MLTSIIQDARFALRTLWREPGWTIAAVCTLALAAGATTAVFSVVNAVVFRPLGYPDASRVVVLEFEPSEDSVRAAWATLSERDRLHRQSSVNYATYEVWRQAIGDELEGVAAYDDAWDYSVRLEGGTERFRGAFVSAHLFSLLRTNPIAGRSFTESDDVPGSPGTAILSYELWQSRLGGTPEAIGRAITINELPYTVVGVMPPGFEFPNREVQFWMPMANAFRTEGAWNYELLGRLGPGWTLEDANTRLQTRTVLAEGREGPTHMHARVSTLRGRLVGGVENQLFVFLAAVLAVLLIACLNVVNLMLTRATHREHEHVVRGALGARPFRLARQLFTESLVLGLLGAALGLGLAMILVDVLVALSPASIPRIEETAIDTRVLGFALALAVGVGIIVGLLPAFRVSRTDLARGLNVGSRGSSDMAHHGRIREALVVVQLALAVVLLVCGGLLLRSFASLLDAQAGFDRGGVLTFETQLPRSRYPDFQEKSRFYEEMLERIEALPGISSAGLTTYLPATEWMSIGRFAVDGYEPLPEEELLTEVQWVTPGYFTALRTSLLQGRMFEERDGQLSPADTTAEGKYLGANVVLINDWLARRYMRDGAAVGGRISYGDHWKAVVGVVADIRHRNIRRAGPQIYFPYPAAVRADMDVVVRTDSDPVSFVPTIRRLVASIDPEVVVYGALPLEDRLAGVVSEPRFRSLLLGLFAVAALLLAAIGVYGVMAYSVARRTRELAIRMALGADRTNVVQQVVLRGLTLAGIGLALGLIGAYVAAGSLQKYLFNLAPTDLLTFTTAALILTGVAILACWIPARRAAKVSPMTALRLE